MTHGEASSAEAAAGHGAARADSWSARHALTLVVVSPILAPVIGSIFNIWYNHLHLNPLLTDGQRRSFFEAIAWYNGIAYPIAIALWLWLVCTMRKPYHAVRLGQETDPVALARARVRVINLPWYAAGIMFVSWVGSIFYFVGVLRSGPEPLSDHASWHLAVSILISTLASLTYGVFAIEILTQRFVFPVLFRGVRPSETPGAIRITLGGRGILWASTACICPVASLLLLELVSRGDKVGDNAGFAIAVAIFGVAFALFSAWMLAKLVLAPIEELRKAAEAVARGDLSTRVTDLRADELGPLIDQFNDMVEEMRVKERIATTFGLHVGREAAEQILERDPGLSGIELEISVMFCDIRNFTAHSASHDAQSVVALLNEFLTVMVEIVERHGGMVNKFLGDGFMALFGAGKDSDGHAAGAVAAGQEMLIELETLRSAGKIHESMGIGIGIHTGLAVVGSIGSPHRLEHTAIGDTVNVASRVEGLTKLVGCPLAFTRCTREQLPDDLEVRPLGAHPVKGVSEPVEVFTL